MLLAALFALLFLTAAAIVITQASKPNTARAWLIAIIGTGSALVLVLVLRLYLPSQFNLIVWQPQALWQANPFLTLDYHSWPYALAIITVCLAVILTDTTRAYTRTSSVNWAGSITLSAVNLIAIMAGDPLTLAMSWALVDAIKLIYLLALQRGSEIEGGPIQAFGLRLASLTALIAATSAGWQSAPGFTLLAIPPKAAIYLLLAAGLRMGVLPLNLSYLETPEMRRGSSMLLRLLPVASALVLISRLPAGLAELPGILPDLLRVLTVLAAIYSALMWATRINAYEARPFWIVALASFAVFSALNDQAAAARAWGLALILSGALLFLFDPPVRRIRFLPLIGLIGLVGLPYTPLVSGWEGVLGQGLNFSALWMILAHALLVLGYLRYVFEANTPITGIEKHARISFPLGLVLIIETLLVIGLVGWPGSFNFGTPFPALVSLGVVFLGVFATLRLGLTVPFTDLQRRLPAYRLARTLFDQATYILSLRWLRQFLAWLFSVLSGMGRVLTRIVEGPGGILWSLVFIMLLVTVFLTQVRLP